MLLLSRFKWQTRVLLAFVCSLLLVFSSSGFAFASVKLVQISSDPYTNPDSQHKTQVEPDTFAFGNTIVSAFQSGRFFDGGASNIGWATSTDGGKTWAHGFLPGTTVFATPPGPAMYHRVSDASVAYDARHKVWIISYLAFFNGTVAHTDVLASRSTDGGLTWGLPVPVNTTGLSNDKNWTVCDDTATSPFYGHCYTEWDDFGNVNLAQMSTSTDGGLTWGAPKSTPDHACILGGQPLVQPNGTVIVPTQDCIGATILSFISKDGGKSWSRVVLAAQALFTLDPGGIRSGPLPSAEIDAAGKVYVTWEDCRFEPPNCNSNDIVMSTSTDGLHWTLPKRIPIDPVGSPIDHLIPGLAVDRSTSGESAHLGLAYYYFSDINCTLATCQLNVGFVSSVNGGASWSAPDHLAGPMSLMWLPNTSSGRMVGDYISTSIIPGGDDAIPVFAVAHPPTGGTTCDVPPVVCDQATYTTSEDLLLIVGGTNTVGNEPTYSLRLQPTLVRHTAN